MCAKSATKVERIVCLRPECKAARAKMPLDYTQMGRKGEIQPQFRAKGNRNGIAAALAIYTRERFLDFKLYGEIIGSQNATVTDLRLWMRAPPDNNNGLRKHGACGDRGYPPYSRRP